MADYRVNRTETTTRQVVNTPVETVRTNTVSKQYFPQQQYTSFSNDPQILRDDFLLKRVDRPEAYQMWHQKNKSQNFTSRILNTNYRTQSYPFAQQANGIKSAQVNLEQNQTYVTNQQILLNFVIVTKDEIEAPWRQECLYLQQIISELERTKKVETKVVKEEDTVKIQELEGIASNLRDQLYAINNYELDSLQSQIDDLQAEEQRLLRQIKQMEEEQEMNSQEQSSEVIQLQNDANKFREEFKRENHDFNEVLEEIKMIEAEIEALSKEDTVVVQKSVVRSTISTTSRTGGSSTTTYK